MIFLLRKLCFFCGEFFISIIGIYVFYGGLSALANRPDIVQDLLTLLDGKLAAVRQATSAKDRKRIHDDSVHTINFLRGICFSYLNKLDEAFAVLNEVISSWVISIPSPLRRFFSFFLAKP